VFLLSFHSAQKISFFLSLSRNSGGLLLGIVRVAMSHNPAPFVGERVRDSHYGPVPEHTEDIAREPSPSIFDIIDAVPGNVSRDTSRPLSSMSDAVPVARDEEHFAKRERGPPVSGCKWSVGWRIPTGMVLSYVLGTV
jgi:hypothetical protein